jgi:hypothetical protein
VSEPARKRCARESLIARELDSNNCAACIAREITTNERTNVFSSAATRDNRAKKLQAPRTRYMDLRSSTDATQRLYVCMVCALDSLVMEVM